MASRRCADCLRALQLSSRRVAQNPRSALMQAPRRTFSSRSLLCASSSTPSDTYTPLTDPQHTRKTASSAQQSKGKKKNASKDKLPINLRAAAEFKKIAGGTALTYTAYGATEGMYKECAKQAEYSMPNVSEDEELPKTEQGEDLGIGGGGWWHEIGLQPTFSTWSQVTMLHLYLLTVRFRCLSSDESKTWQQHLLDHYFYDAENKMMTVHRLTMRSLRDKYLKDMFVQWRGLLVAYDEGLVRGDAVLAAAVWRNVFRANEDVDLRRLAAIVSWIRRTLKQLEDLSDEEFVAGTITFESPAAELDLVAYPAKLTKFPLSESSGTQTLEKP